MRKTRREAATTALFACRLDVSLIDQVRDLARKNRRTIGEELARILDYALPAIVELDEIVKRAELQAIQQRHKQRMKEVEIRKSAEGRR